MIDLEDGTDSADLLHVYMLDMERYPLLSKEEEDDIGKRATLGDVEAQQKLVNHNLRWAFTIARKYQGHSGMPLMDLIQEGNIGLIKASQRFDYTRGFRFTTYATWWIRQAIGRAIQDKGHTIHRPVYISVEIDKMKTAIRELLIEVDHEPSREEIAERAGFSVERIEDLEQWSMTPASLDAPMSGYSHKHDPSEIVTLADFLEDSDTPDMADQAEHAILSERIEEALACLTEREAEIIRSRYGLGDYKPLTLQELGNEMGVSRERIRQVERGAEGKLRRPLERAMQELEEVSA